VTGRPEPPARPAPVIEADRLVKRFGRRAAVDGVSFTVRRGMVFGFLGPNGSGKTTTIAMLLGVIRPTSGEVRLFGRYGWRELHRARRRIGATLESPNFYPYLSGFDNLRVVATIKGHDAEEVERVLSVVGLSDRAGGAFAEYSLGMKHRLAIAAAVLGDPELVILDEPTNGLDPDGIREIRAIVVRLAAEGRTIVLSSHLLQEVERTCTHVAILKRGRIVAAGPLSELTAGTTQVELRSGDPERLGAALHACPEVLGVRREGDLLVAELRGGDAEDLSRFLAGQRVYLSHLAARGRSLEEVFVSATGGGEAG
jgi:ABC-type multidrug transport system ATPase subunit